MHFDAALNLVWLLLGLIALAGTARAALGTASGHRRPAAWLHIVGVGLIVAALFPYISATDDVLRVEHFNSQHEHGHPGKRTSNDNLMRLYEAMDSPLVCRACEVFLTFLIVWIVFTPGLVIQERSVPFRAGRSPPFCPIP